MTNTMKKVSISVNTLNKMKFGVSIYHTAEEAQKKIDEYKACGIEEGMQVAEAYEKGGIYKWIEYKVFRGYVISC